jgi:hypothetical protein
MMPQYGTPWLGPSTPATATPRPVAAPAPLPVASKPRAPRLALRLLLPAAAKHVPDERLTVELRETGGRSVWRCERAAPLGEGALTDWCPLRDPLRAGTYTLSTSLRVSQKETGVSQTFPLTLDELALEVDVRLTAAIQLEELLVTRVLPAHPEVQLKRDWTNPNTSVPLRYSLQNGSPTQTLYLSGIQGVVMASLDRADRAGFVTHTRGTVCDAPHGTVTVAPGATAYVEEGHFVGPLRPLDEGSYRTRLRYAIAPLQRASVTPRAVLHQVHEIYDDVRITSDRLEPVEDIRDPFSCDPPFRVDLDGVRHIKPECLGY